MDKKDFRLIGIEAQEALRTRAVYLVITDGKTRAEAARIIGASRQTVSGWVQNYHSRGDEGLVDKRRESHRKGKGILSSSECKWICRAITDMCPDQMKLPFALWTSRAVMELIERKFNKRLGLSTVQLYLQRWGFTPQKPLFRAKERHPIKLQHWIEVEYPKIVLKAKQEGAMIFWGDETGISNQDQIGRSYAPKGQTPVIAHVAKRISTSMISAVNNRGLMKFMLYEKALNVEKFQEFLQKLIKDSDQKILLIVDNLKVHHAKIIKEWLAKPEIKNCLELFYLPAYAPDYNPDEHLNNDLKQQLRQKPQSTSQLALLKNTESLLLKLQSMPDRIKSYFSLPSVKYAA